MRHLIVLELETRPGSMTRTRMVEEITAHLDSLRDVKNSRITSISRPAVVNDIHPCPKCDDPGCRLAREIQAGRKSQS